MTADYQATEQSVCIAAYMHAYDVVPRKPHMCMKDFHYTVPDICAQMSAADAALHIQHIVSVHYGTHSSTCTIL
jgi:hypothetical protein